MVDQAGEQDKGLLGVLFETALIILFFPLFILLLLASADAIADNVRASGPMPYNEPEIKQRSLKRVDERPKINVRHNHVKHRNQIRSPEEPIVKVKRYNEKGVR